MLRFAAAVLSLSALVLSGCFGDGGSGLQEPGSGVKATGRTIHLKVTVEDFLKHQVFDGYGANLWAFCVTPFSATDEVSKAAIEPFPRLPGDGVDSSGNPLPEGCGVPAPTIRVRQGDTVKVEFSHSHFHPHTIHWHGQLVDWQDDGAPGVSQDSVASGQKFTYEFVAKKAGTLWYHCHVDTQLHVMQGLYGMFIVEPADDSQEPNVDREFALVLSTLNAAWVWEGNPLHNHPAGCGTSGTPGCVNPPIDSEADVFMINGHSYPYTMEQEGTLLKIVEGEKIRIRVLNAGTTVETLHPHGHDMLVTHRDGNPLTAPFYVDVLTIGPAERYDVVIEGNNPGPWMIHTHVNDHETNCGRAPGGMHTMLVYDGFEDEMHKFAAGAEAPASCNYSPGREISGDIDAVRSLDLGTTQELPATTAVTVPIDVICTLRSATFRATLSAASAFESLNDIVVRLVGPDGAELGSQSLGGGDPTNPGATVAAFTLPSNSVPYSALQAGNYTLELSGRSVEAQVLAEARVDHFESYADAETASHSGIGLPPCTESYQLPGGSFA